MKTHIYVRLLPAALAATLSVSAVIAQTTTAPKSKKAHRTAKHVTARLHAQPKAPNKALVPSNAQAQVGQNVPTLFHGPMAAYAPPVVDQDSFRRLDKSVDLATAGDADAGRGDWAQASAHYQQALDLWPDNSTALYGLGKAADAAGDTTTAIRYYRTATFADNSPHTKWNTQTNDVTCLMEFALLLSKAGQEPEARAVYNRAAHLLNYQDADTNGGKPYLKVLLPEFESGSDPLAYTPHRLQAMAHVAISIEAGGSGAKETIPQVQEAVRLYPDSPITNFYLGKQLDRMQKKGAEAAYAKAAALGDAQVVAAAQKALEDRR